MGGMTILEMIFFER